MVEKAALRATSNDWYCFTNGYFRAMFNAIAGILNEYRVILYFYFSIDKTEFIDDCVLCS